MSNLKNHFMMLSNGERFYPFDPDPAVMDIEVIAKALSKMCRFSGQCNQFYSVAQHSCIVSDQCSPKNAFLGLMHDATEAFVADLPRPLKRGLPEYQEVEVNVWRALCERYNMPYDLPQEVHDIDRSTCIAEGLVLFNDPYWEELARENNVERINFTPQTPEVAEANFFFLYSWLKGTADAA